MTDYELGALVITVLILFTGTLLMARLPVAVPAF
jgi:hypothetical protein